MIGKIKDKIIFETIKDQYINRVPFHKLLGLKMSKFDFETAEMRSEVISFFKKWL